MEYIIQENTLKDIADAIREVKGDASYLNPVDMPSAIRSIGKGALNYSVVRYPIGATLPDVAKEHTIAIFSDIEITGYAFSSEEPYYTYPGLVWIYTSTYSKREFNAIIDGNNILKAYPVWAKQYTEDAEWISVEMQITFDGSSWDTFELVFYQDGVFNEDVFGKVTHNGYIHAGQGLNNGAIGLSRYGEINHADYVDITPYSTFQYDIVVSNYGRVDVGIKNQAGTTIATTGQNQGVGTITLDISDINEPVKVWFYVYGNANSNNSLINNLKFLP